MKYHLHLILLFLFVSWAGFGQTIKVTGVVISAEDKEPVIGASVIVKGTPSIGTVTGIDGDFTLNVPQGSKTLIISFIGMKSQEAAVKEQMNIVLQPDEQTLTEIVVTGIGGKIDKRLFTGATDKIGGDKARLDGMADISRGLEGRSAGVSVQNVSGTFGTAPKIRVRGATSIYGDSKPLWVVDGVVVENITDVSADALSSGDAVTLISSAISGLNADDIESFQILKDGSATSIYGARAMAGVIVVTTKKGRAGTSSINYTGEYTYRLKPSYRNFNIMNSQEQMGIYKEMEQKGWLNLADVFRAQESGVYGRMYQLINAYDPATNGFGIINADEFKNIYLREAEMRNTNWFDELFNSNVMHNHAISVSSGTDKSTTYASLSAMFDDGWTKQSNVQRYTANLNTTYKISDALSLNLISNGSYREQRAPGTLSQDVDVVNGSVKRDFDINPYSYALNTSRAADPKAYYTSNYAPFNIFNELNNNYIDLNIVDLKFQGEIKWKVLKNVEVGFLSALNYKSTMQIHNVTGEANQANAYRAGIVPPDNTTADNNPLLYKDPDNLNALPITVLPGNTGIYRNTNYKMRSIDTRATISWVEVFKDVHAVNFFGGWETNATDRYRNNFTGWGLNYGNGMIPEYVLEYFKQAIERNNKYYSIARTRARSLAGFASATYGYAGKYSINLTFRDEATNKSSVSGSPWLPTWNMGLGWNVHEEKFFKNIKDKISHLSFRTSYSLTASPVPDFITNSEIFIDSYSPYRPFTNIQERGALRINSLQNTELTYEKKNEFNFGFDLGILSNRLNFSFDIYSRKNFDLIGLVTTTGIGGEITKFANQADMDGNGFDLTISSQNIKGKKFSWNTDFIIANSRTKVTKLSVENIRVIDLVSGEGGTGFTMVGYPARALFSIPFVGLDENGFPVLKREDGTITTQDDAYVNFQNRENLDYLKYEGPSEPTWTGSLGNIFTCGNFKLNVFLTYSFGNKVRLTPAFNAQYSDLTAMTREFKNRWVVPGDEEYTNIPTILTKKQFSKDRESYRTLYNAYNFSDQRIADGGFIRLKEVSLTYDFPKEWLFKHMTNLSLKLQATNLLLLYADKKLNGQDPEFMNSGGVAVPSPQQITMTLRAGF
jgi:TonB-linked SusC/RagA family outer membrane protein